MRWVPSDFINGTTTVKNMNKKQNQKQHFKRRMIQRFGINVNKLKYKEYLIKIKTNKFLIGRRSRRISYHLVKDDNKAIVVVYDNLRGVLVSAFPVDFISRFFPTSKILRKVGE